MYPHEDTFNINQWTTAHSFNKRLSIRGLTAQPVSFRVYQLITQYTVTVDNFATLELQVGRASDSMIAPTLS